MTRNLPEFFKDPHSIAGLQKNEPVLLALSGGADSSALLHLLCRLREDHYFPICAAHVNHGIRTENYGNEALRDENFCRELCESLGVELFVHRIDIPTLARSTGKSLETAARDARYAFFKEIMASRGIKLLITAHNADDNLETQLFNLCRGCGVSGMSGIPEKREFDGIGLVTRPILSANKSDILGFCADTGIKYVVDSTNLEDDCTRNRIRHNILPELKEIFGSPERAGLRLSRSAAEDDDFINLEAERIVNADKTVDAVLLANLHPALAKRIVMLAYGRAFESSLESVHIENVIGFIRESNGKKNGRISLPSKSAAIVCDGRLTFSADEESESLSYEVPLAEGLVEISGADFAVAISSKDAEVPERFIRGGLYTLYAHAYVKGIDPSLCSASSRREGETIFENNMHKKIKKIMCDKKIPSSDRGILPIIRESGEAIYVPLCAVADRVRATEKNRQYLISIYKKHISEETENA